MRKLTDDPKPSRQRRRVSKADEARLLDQGRLEGYARAEHESDIIIANLEFVVRRDRWIAAVAIAILVILVFAT